MSPGATALRRGGQRAAELALLLGGRRGYQGAPPGVRFLPQTTAVTAAPPSQLAEAVAKRLGGDDNERARTAAALARTLRPQDRIFLAHALAQVEPTLWATSQTQLSLDRRRIDLTLV